MKDVIVTLNGRFSVVDRLGMDLTPNGNRARALLAILILSPEAKRPRLDLQSLLWGPVDLNIGRTRLRQCLTEIRSALRRSQTDAIQALMTNHTFAWLDTDIIGIDPLDIENHGEQLLSNVRVPGPEYQQWLHERIDERRANDPLAQDAQTPRIAEKRTLWFHTESDKTHGLVLDRLQTQLMQNITDQTPLRCVEQHDGSTLDKQNSDILFQIIPFLSAQNRCFSLSIKSVGAREILWRHLMPCAEFNDDNASQDAALFTAHEAADNILKALRRGIRSTNENVRADHLVGKALKRLLTFIPEKIVESKLLLQEAQSIRPHPAQLAWLCTVIMVESIEMPHRRTASYLSQYRDYADTALSEAPRNALVLALLSQARLMIDGDLESAKAMAEEALEINPGLAITHIANAACNKYGGQIQSAIDHANRGLEIGVNSPLRHWWLMNLSLTHISADQFDEAIVTANKALLGAPSFKAPMRHLYALYLYTGQPQQAAIMLSRLQRLEPGFSLAHVRANPSYPARTLRESKLIDQTDIDPQDF